MRINSRNGRAEHALTKEDDNTRSGRGNYRIKTLEIEARPLEPALYLVATPIGNLGDITIRALETLAAADVVAAEDTRVTRVLLDRFAISARPYAYHEYNADEVGPKLVAALAQGKSVALVSDAGTPLVSDPGYRLVKEVLAAGLKVVPIPGPSSVVTALSASGLPNESFLFAGFLPQKEKARRDRLEEVRDVPGTLIFFESPHRLPSSLADMLVVLGDRDAAVCRELTKTFEEFRRGTLSELAAHYAENDNVKGEIVICVGPPSAKKAPAGQDLDDILRSLMRDMPTAKAAAEAARQTGLPRKDLYQRLLELKD
jgi:16S rRNA (cytidine1402-2'-O)-methyltransferase